MKNPTVVIVKGDDGFIVYAPKETEVKVIDFLKASPDKLKQLDGQLKKVTKDMREVFASDI